MGGGLRPPRPTWVSHTTASQGNRAMGDSYTISPSNHPQARRTQNLTPHGTCGLQAARPRPQGPLQIPAGTCRVTKSAGSQWAQGSWGCGPLLRRRKQECSGQFYSVGNGSGCGPSPLVLPLAREIIKAADVPKPAVSRHCVQLVPVVLADLIVAGELLGAGPGLGVLFTWWQQEGCAPCQQHVPDAVGIVIVVAGHHGSVDGDGHSGHGDAGQEVEDPALPGRGVAVAPAPAAVHLEKTTARVLAQGLQPQLPGACPGLGVWAAWRGSRAQRSMGSSGPGPGHEATLSPCGCHWQPSADLEDPDPGLRTWPK